MAQTFLEVLVLSTDVIRIQFTDSKLKQVVDGVYAEQQLSFPGHLAIPVQAAVLQLFKVEDRVGSLPGPVSIKETLQNVYEELSRIIRQFDIEISVDLASKIFHKRSTTQPSLGQSLSTAPPGEMEKLQRRLENLARIQTAEF